MRNSLKSFDFAWDSVLSSMYLENIHLETIQDIIWACCQKS